MSTVPARMLPLEYTLPAALLTLGVLAYLGEASPVESYDKVSPWLVLPYVLVLVLAVIGWDVLVVLSIGLVVAGAFGYGMVADFDTAAYAEAA